MAHVLALVETIGDMYATLKQCGCLHGINNFHNAGIVIPRRISKNVCSVPLLITHLPQDLVKCWGHDIQV